MEALNLGKGYTGRVDQFNHAGEASFEIHVYDKSGTEVGVYGPKGWISKHGLEGRPEGLPPEVENSCRGIAVDKLRKAGVIPEKGRFNLKGSGLVKFLRRWGLFSIMEQETKPSNDYVCELKPDFDTCPPRLVLRSFVMQYVRVDPETGAVEWDSYFEYLKSVRTSLPVGLFAYATNWEHYSLDGANSLHDAWLTAAHFDYRAQVVTLSLLSARRDRTHVLRYQGVERYEFCLAVGYRSGDRDLLAHEFRLEGDSIIHELGFVGDGRITLRFSNLTAIVELASSTER